MDPPGFKEQENYSEDSEDEVPHQVTRIMNIHIRHFNDLVTRIAHLMIDRSNLDLEDREDSDLREDVNHSLRDFNTMIMAAMNQLQNHVDVIERILDMDVVPRSLATETREHMNRALTSMHSRDTREAPELSSEEDE